jgi:hypothetical protein
MLSVIALVLAVAAFVISVVNKSDSTAQRQADYREIDRLVHEVNVRNILLENHDAMLIRAGIKQPGDLATGPTGNIEFNPHQER